MNIVKAIVSLIVISIVQVACYAPEQELPTPNTTPITAEIPERVVQGEEYTFSVTVPVGTTCHAGIGFFEASGKWITEELPIVVAEKSELCIWAWEVPKDAADGIGEFRGYVEFGELERNIFPVTFCIGDC